MDNIKKILINIWDDFFEDGYVPDGEIQKTYAYVENGGTSNDFEKEVLTKLYHHIIAHLQLSGVKIELLFFDSKSLIDKNKIKKLIQEYGEEFFYKRWQINFTNIAHKQLDFMLKILAKYPLEYNGIPYSIYSES